MQGMSRTGRQTGLRAARVMGAGEGCGKDWQKDSTIVELFKKRES